MSRRGLALAVSTFSVVPVPGRGSARLDRAGAVGAIHWLPAVGAALAAVAGLPAAALLGLTERNSMVAAVAAVALLALLTRGLHLDGLADVADALGSRADPERAQQIMHQSDIGPFGVLALVFAILAQVFGLQRAAAGSVWRPLCVLVTAAATARVCVLLAARPGLPASRFSRFGALVAGGVRLPVTIAIAAGLLVAGAGLGALVSSRWWFWPLAQLLAIAAGLALERHFVRRLDGISGDVFGALIELSGLIVVLALALGGS